MHGSIISLQICESEHTDDETDIFCFVLALNQTEANNSFHESNEKNKDNDSGGEANFEVKPHPGGIVRVGLQVNYS